MQSLRFTEIRNWPKITGEEIKTNKQQQKKPTSVSEMIGLQV